MKIGFLITYFYPKTGGAESNCYYTARELAKRNEVHVFCSGEKDSDEIIDGIHVHRSKQVFRAGYYFAFYPGIGKSIERYKLDVLHLHGFGFIQHDFLMSKIRKNNPHMKIICTPHGPFMALKSYGLVKRMIKNVYINYIIKSLRNYDIIIEVNPYQWKWMTGDYGIKKSKIRFVPNGITPETFSSIKKEEIDKLKKKYDLEDKFVISYVGRMQKYKGLEQVIRAMRDIENKNLVFVAIGRDGGDLERLEGIVKELELENQVIFTGEVSEKEKLVLLEISEIFMFPSEWEAFGIGMLESMARKNAVISSKNEGGLYLIGKKNGRLFEYGNIKQLAKELIYLMNNEIIRKSMQKENYKKASKFIWKDIALKLEKIYEYGNKK